VIMFLVLPHHFRNGHEAKIRWGEKISNIDNKLTRQQCCATSFNQFVTRISAL